MRFINIQTSTLFILLSCLYQSSNSEFYTAIAELEKLLETEKYIVDTLELYLKIEELRLDKVKWLSQQYTKLHEAAKTNAELFLSNPVNAYLLVKRLTTDWEITNYLIEGYDNRVFIQNITSQVGVIPSKEDLYGAADALLRLQDIYLLETSTLARGLVKGTTPFTELTAGDCFELGKFAYETYEYNRTLPWMQEALNRFEKEDSMKTVDKGEVLEYIAHSHYNLKNFSAAAEATELLLKFFPDHPRGKSNLILYRLHEAEYEANKKAKGDIGEEPEVQKYWETPEYHVMKNYEKLCRGESIKTKKEENLLNCYYTTNNRSYLLLQPAKVEVLNLEPRLVMYHDVLKDYEAAVIKDLALPMLERATVNNATTGDVEIANYRISKSAWLHMELHPLIYRIDKRIQELTGIDSDYAENLHVINYGIGGHYEPHYDWAHPTDNIQFLQERGNRIATWIFYLSDVPAGGSTVFPKIGAEVKPVKGAAAFWYNLHRNGTGDERTRHAACPVLAGSKWVANKWLHEFGNEFTRPCSSSRQE